MIDVRKIIQKRTEMLEQSNPDLSVEYEIEEGDWGLITLREKGALVGFEFVETERSWSRPDALIQYNEIANEGYYIAVIVPDEVFQRVNELIYGLGEESVTLVSYESLGISPISVVT